jgi:hypothetical protein
LARKGTEPHYHAGMVRSLRTTVLCASAAALTLSVAADASAAPLVSVSAGALAGYALKPSALPASDVNPYGVGLGVRGGVTVLGLYGGATFLYYLGQSTSFDVGGEKKSNAMAYGLEAGYELGLGPVALRPYVGVGFMNIHFAVTGTDIDDRKSRLYVAPGVTGLFTLMGWFVGADLRYTLVTNSGENGLHSPAAFLTGGKTF